MSADIEHKLPRHVFFVRLAIAMVVAVMAVAGVAYIGFGIDLLTGSPAFIGCPIRLVTGHDCPGCGMTRAMVSLGQGRFVQAVQFNPFSPVLLFFMLFFLIRGRGPHLPNQHRYAATALMAAALLWVMRVLG